MGNYTVRIVTARMDDELVLLTSYFNLANGRRQDTADTFRVDPSLPSSTSPDGTASLYIVTESSTSGHIGPRARRLAADTIAWEYSTHGDVAPASRLKGALRTAHEEVQREFDGHVSVGVSVIAVEHNDVYLAQVPPSQVYVLHEGNLHSIPAAMGGSSPFSNAVGSTAAPKILVFRDEIAAGDVLSLCSSWFNRTADPDELRECFGAGTADDIAECLLDLAKQHDVRDASVIVIEAALSSDLEGVSRNPETHGFSEQLDMAVQSLAGVGRMLWQELQVKPAGRPGNGRAGASEIDLADEHTTVHTPRGRTPLEEEMTTEIPRVDPGRTAPPEEGQRESFNPDATAVWDLSELDAAQAPTSPPPDGTTQEVPAVSPEMEAAAADETVAEEVRQPRGRRYREEYDEPTAEPTEEPRSEIDQINQRLQVDLDDMSDVIPPVQAFPETGSTEPSRIYATSKDIQSVNRRPRRFGNMARPGGRDSAVATPVLRPGLSDINLRERVPPQTPPAVIWVAAAVILLLAAFAGYKILKRGHSAATNPYPALARTEIARAAAATDPGVQDRHLAKAQTDIRLAAQNGDPKADIAALNRQLQTTADTVHHITRETAPILIADFTRTTGSNPTQLVTSPDTLYVLDSGTKKVYSLPPTPGASPTVIVQSGDQYNGFTIGTPQEVGSAGPIALVYDDHNTLVRDNAGNKTAVSLTQPSPAQKITQMVGFNTDIYLLDVAGNQIWRYPDSAVANNPPTGFFSPNTPDIGQAVSFTVDSTDMYILKTNGQVLKYDEQSAGQQKYSPSFRQPLTKPSFIFTDDGLKYIWIADPGTGRIVQINKATGAYVRAYVSGSAGMDLSSIKGLTVQSGGKTLYVLTGNKIYSFPIAP